MEGYLKQQSLDEKIDMWMNDGVPPKVREWAEFQILISEVERRKELTDANIRNSLILQFKKLDPTFLKNSDKARYAELLMKYGI